VRVRVSEHRLVNIRRYSLCENCTVRNCTSFNGSRVTTCPNFRPRFVIFMRCRECGEVYDPYQDISSLDYELCPECNRSRKKEECPIVLVCWP
jgi:hypothetical protein